MTLRNSLAGIEHNEKSRWPKVGFQFDSQKLHNQSDVRRYADALVEWARRRATVYQGPQLAVWGSDFQFTNAEPWFSQMDTVINEVNQNPLVYGNVTVRYTTLAGYFDHLHSLKLKFPLIKNLSFEYGWPHAWEMALTGNVSRQRQTGAPSSRAAYKQQVRRAAQLTRAAQASHAMAVARGVARGVNGTTRTGAAPGTAQVGAANQTATLQVARDANGIAQHHDSVTGTMMDEHSVTGGPSTFPLVGWPDDTAQRCGESPNCRVKEDYIARLDEGSAASEAVLAASLQQLAAWTVRGVGQEMMPAGQAGLAAMQARAEKLAKVAMAKAAVEKEAAPKEEEALAAD